MGKFNTKSAMQIVARLAPIIIAAIVGAYATKYFSDDSREIQYLDYRVNTSGLSTVPTVKGKSLKALLDKQPIENLYQISIELFNLSDFDYKDIPVYLKLSSNSNESFNILAAEVAGSESVPELVDSLKVNVINEDTKRYGYNIRVANRGEFKKGGSVFLAKFLITGSIPETNITINKKGLKSRRFDYFDYKNKQKLFPQWAVTTFIFLMAILLYSFLFRASVWLQRKSTRKQNKAYKEWATKQITSKEANSLNVKQLLDKFETLKCQHVWLSFKPKFLRPFLGPERPKSVTTKKDLT